MGQQLGDHAAGTTDYCSPRDFLHIGQGCVLQGNLRLATKLINADNLSCTKSFNLLSTSRKFLWLLKYFGVNGFVKILLFYMRLRRFTGMNLS